MSTVRIQVNKALPGHPVGKIVSVAADSEGTPLDLQWRRRLKDARIDNCCEIVAPVAPRARRRARREVIEPPEGRDPEKGEES
jgi:hypothetical protein